MENKRVKLTGARVIYKRLLIAAIVTYVVAYCVMQADQYRRIGEMDHKLAHVSSGYNCGCHTK